MRESMFEKIVGSTRLLTAVAISLGGSGCASTSEETKEVAYPSPETAVINRFTRSASWRGKLPPKTPGGPELSTHGHMTCRWFAANWWNVCDIVDNIGSGKDARQWTAYWVSGWDSGRKEYRGYIFDSAGTSSEMRGQLQGKKLIYESLTDLVMHGQPTRLRFTFNSDHPEGIDFTAERTKDGKWTLIEREVHVPDPADPQ